MNKVNLTDLAILQDALLNGIINVEDVRRALTMKKEEYYLSLHKYEIKTYFGNGDPAGGH